MGTYVRRKAKQMKNRPAPPPGLRSCNMADVIENLNMKKCQVSIKKLAGSDFPVNMTNCQVVIRKLARRDYIFMESITSDCDDDDIQVIFDSAKEGIGALAKVCPSPQKQPTGHREARPELPMLRPKLPRMSQPDSEKVAEWLPSAGPGGGAGQDRVIK